MDKRKELDKYLHHCFNVAALWKRKKAKTSLAAPRVRICLSMQGARVLSLAWEDPTCLGATKPVPRSKRNQCNEKPERRNKEQPLLTEAGEKPLQRNEDPAQPKIK